MIKPAGYSYWPLLPNLTHLTHDHWVSIDPRSGSATAFVLSHAPIFGTKMCSVLLCIKPQASWQVIPRSTNHAISVLLSEVISCYTSAHAELYSYHVQTLIRQLCSAQPRRSTRKSYSGITSRTFIPLWSGSIAISRHWIWLLLELSMYTIEHLFWHWL